MKRIDKMKEIAAEAKALGAGLPTKDIGGGVTFRFEGSHELSLLISSTADYRTIRLNIAQAEELHKFLKKAFEEDVN